MPLIRVKPAPGRLLRNHQRDYRAVPPDGEEVEDDFTWQKRLVDGDAVLLAPSGAHGAPGAAMPLSIVSVIGSALLSGAFRRPQSARRVNTETHPLLDDTLARGRRGCPAGI